MAKWYQVEKDFISETDDGDEIIVSMAIVVSVPDDCIADERVIEDAAESAADRIFDQGVNYE